MADSDAATTQIRVVQVRSAIGTKPKHRSTLKALGLGRIGKSRVLPDRPEIRGMVAQVTHLVRVEERPGVGPGPHAPGETGDGAPVGAGPRSGPQDSTGGA